METIIITAGITAVVTIPITALVCKAIWERRMLKLVASVWDGIGSKK